MKNNIYIMRNDLTNRFEGTFESPTDLMASVHFRDSMIDQKTGELSPYYSNVQLARIGSVDIEKGIIEALEAPIYISKLQSKNGVTPIDEIEGK